MYEVVYKNHKGIIFTRRRYSMPNFDKIGRNLYSPMGWEILSIKRLKLRDL